MVQSPLIQRRMQIFFVGLSHSWQTHCNKKLPRPRNNFGIKTTRGYYRKICNKCEDLVLHNVDITSVEKIFKSLDVAKVSGIDQISARFLKDGAVIAIHLANIINLLIKLDTFPWQCESKNRTFV